MKKEMGHQTLLFIALEMDLKVCCNKNKKYQQLTLLLHGQICEGAKVFGPENQNQKQKPGV